VLDYEINLRYNCFIAGEIIIFYLKNGILDKNFVKVLTKKQNYNINLYRLFKSLNVSFYFLKENKTILNEENIQMEFNQNLYKNILLLDLKKELENLLKTNKIDYLFYKGAFTSEHIYENIAYRFLSDIDLLINENQLKKVKKIIDENFKITKYKKSKSFYTNEHRFYENEFLIEHKGNEISLDLHISFIQKAKFNIDYSLIFKEKKIEHQLLALIIQVSNDYFINKKFKIRKITYLTFYILANELNLKVPIDLIKLKKHEKLILNNMIMTKTFRINQIFLFYYTFDEISDYKKLLTDKILKIRKNGVREVVKSLKKIK